MVHGHGGAPLVQRRVERVPRAPPLGSRVVGVRSPGGPPGAPAGRYPAHVGARGVRPPPKPPEGVLRRVPNIAPARAAHHGVHLVRVRARVRVRVKVRVRLCVRVSVRVRVMVRVRVRVRVRFA